MLSQRKSLIIAPLFLSLLALIFSFNFAYAGLNNWNDSLETSAASGGKYKTSPKGTNAAEAVASYLGGVLLIIPALGTILIVRMVWAGYQWMTAGGNAEQIEAAQRTMRHAIIGVILFISLYAITYFMIDRLTMITNYNNSAPQQ